MQATLAHTGTRSSCSSMPPAKAAQVQARGRSGADAAGWAAALTPHPRRIDTEAGEQRKTAVPVRRSALGRHAHARKREPVALTVRFGIDHPARQLRQPRLGIRQRNGGEIEQPQLGAARLVLLHQERRLACIGLPVHLARRVAVAKRPQPDPLVHSRAAARAVPGRWALCVGMGSAPSGAGYTTSSSGVCTQVHARNSPKGCALAMRTRPSGCTPRASGASATCNSPRAPAARSAQALADSSSAASRRGRGAAAALASVTCSVAARRRTPAGRGPR